jgi:hypothetical protein
MVPRGLGGNVLCPEPCALRGTCTLGLLDERLDDEDSACFEIECPEAFRAGPTAANGAWTAATLSEMCAHLTILSGTAAFLGTVTVRFSAPVPVGERLIGRATLDGRERRKLFVSASLSSATGTELASASTIMIAL